MFVLLGLVNLASTCVAQDNATDVTPLAAGTTIEREISGGQTQSFLVGLRQGQFLRAVATSHDIDVAVMLYGPDGQKLLNVDLLKYPSPEPLSFEAENTGDYRLDIHADAAPIVRGRYALVSEIKPRTEESDRRRLSAERLLIESSDLEREGSKESLQRAINKRGEALAIWRKLGDRYWEAYSLHYSGRATFSLGKNREALEAYDQAVKIRREIGDRLGEATTMNNSGLVYVSVSESQKALESYRQAIEISRAIHDLAGEGRTLGNLADLYDGLGEKLKALDCYKQTLLIKRTLGDKSGEAATLNNLGIVYRDVGEKQKALDYCNQALPLFRTLGDKPSEAATLVNVGAAYSDLGEKQKALDYYDQALPLFRALGNKSGEADTLIDYGLAYRDLGEKQKALDYYNQALPLKRAVGDKSGEAASLIGLGNVYFELGEKQKALDYYNQALPLTRAVGDKSGEATTLISLGNAYLTLGEMQKALEYYNQALPLKRAIGDKTGEAATLHDLGLAYNNLGEMQKALDYYNQALPLKRAAGDKSGEANTLNNLGSVYRKLGEGQRALDYYHQALLLNRAAGDKSSEATSLIGLGNVNLTLGETQQALEYYRQALPLKRTVGDKLGEADTLNNLGSLYRALKEKQKALDYYNQALPLRRAVGDKAGEAMTLDNLMWLWRSSNTSIAVFYGKQSVNVYQQLRANIKDLDREIQNTYLQTIAGSYRYLVDLLITEQRLPEAQQVLAMLKEQEYFDFVRRDSAEVNSLTARATLTTDEAALETEYNKLAEEVTGIGRERGELFSKKERTAEEEKRLSGLENQLNVATDHFQKFLEQLKVKLNPATRQAERINQVEDALGMQKTLRELANGAVLLYTLVGEDKYRVMLVTPDTEQAYENPISATDLARKVLAFREALQNPQIDPAPLARELYKILIGPKLRHDLEQTRAQTLMWSLDGVLRYVPVAALQDEAGKYLVETYRSVIFTPATRDRLKDPVASHWQGLGLGVSKGREVVLADTARHVTFNPLPGVPQELRSIIREQPAGANADGGGVLDGRVLLDESFTKDSFRAALRQRYSLVHIASHFMFQPGNETDSFLLLGGADTQNNRLTIAELKRLSFEGVDLLTLSACETAMGGEKANGVEVESFGVLAQRQGAESVMATLWPVADVSTPILMREFYRLRETNLGMTKVEALREAQLSLLRGNDKNSGNNDTHAGRGVTLIRDNAAPVAGSRPFKLNSNAPYAHPFYWAPFILIGNWK